jgi:DNA gyrase subunit A
MLAPERLAELERLEELVLAVTRNGYGKRTSSYEYRITNRGGSGIIGIETSARNGPVAATFAVGESDHVLLVTDQGRMIRIPANEIRIAGRATQGVRLFDVGADEHVVSAARLAEGEVENGAEPEARAAAG